MPVPLVSASLPSTVMGAALSAAVMPCTRVPVTITVSWLLAFCAMAGAADHAKAAADVPSNKACLRLNLDDTSM